MSATIRLDQNNNLASTAATGINVGKSTAAKLSSPANAASSFAQALADASNVKFSNHAQQRLEKRQISLTEDGLARLSQAVDKASQRGGRESMVLMDDLAFIVNVKDRVIVTALDSNSRREGVFTQIDSVVFAEASTSANV